MNKPYPQSILEFFDKMPLTNRDELLAFIPKRPDVILETRRTEYLYFAEIYFTPNKKTISNLNTLQDAMYYILSQKCGFYCNTTELNQANGTIFFFSKFSVHFQYLRMHKKIFTPARPLINFDLTTPSPCSLEENYNLYRQTAVMLEKFKEALSTPNPQKLS